MSLKIGNLVGGGLAGAVGGAVVGIATQAAGKLLNALFMSGRSIGGIIPDVTIEEHHVDTLTITDHSVEQGAAITDHAFKNPAEITMRVAWSNSKSIANSIITGSLFKGQIANANDLYRQLLELQESRKVFDLVTGKRTYTSMLIKQLAVTTDHDSENSLIVTALMRQIIIVQTDAVELKPAEQHSDPQDTSSILNAGTKLPIKAPNQSALFSLFGR